MLVPVTSRSIRNFEARAQLALELNKTRLIIWNKIVITHFHNFKAADRSFCSLQRSTLQFRRVAVARTRNFLQSLPVVCVANPSQIDFPCFRRHGGTFDSNYYHLMTTRNFGLFVKTLTQLQVHFIF